MITNDRQLDITRRAMDGFSRSITILKGENISKWSTINKALLDALQSQYDDLEEQANQYIDFKKGKSLQIKCTDIGGIPDILIDVRKILGLTQEELAKKIKLKKQQISRYELTMYRGVDISRMAHIARSMGLEISLVASVKKVD